MRRRLPISTNPRERGYTLVEMLLVLAIGMTMVAFSIPLISSTVSNYKLRSATTSVTGAIQSVRYRAIFEGTPFTITFTKVGSQYQIMRSDPNTGVFANVGGPIPFASTSVQLGTDTKLQLLPSGRLQVLQGSPTLSLNYAGKTKKIKVSSYGNTSVSD